MATRNRSSLAAASHLARSSPLPPGHATEFVGQQVILKGLPVLQDHSGTVEVGTGMQPAVLLQILHPLAARLIARLHGPPKQVTRTKCDRKYL